MRRMLRRRAFAAVAEIPHKCEWRIQIAVRIGIRSHQQNAVTFIDCDILTSVHRRRRIVNDQVRGVNIHAAFFAVPRHQRDLIHSAVRIQIQQFQMIPRHRRIQRRSVIKRTVIVQIPQIRQRIISRIAAHTLQGQILPFLDFIRPARIRFRCDIAHIHRRRILFIPYIVKYLQRDIDRIRQPLPFHAPAFQNPPRNRRDRVMSAEPVMRISVHFQFPVIRQIVVGVLIPRSRSVQNQRFPFIDPVFLKNSAARIRLGKHIVHIHFRTGIIKIPVIVDHHQTDPLIGIIVP